MGKARTKLEDKRTAKHSNDANRGAAGTKAGQRDAATVRRLNMYKKRAVRDKKGKLLYQARALSTRPTPGLPPRKPVFSPEPPSKCTATRVPARRCVAG